MSKTLVRKGISFVHNSCLVVGSLAEGTSDPGKSRERGGAGVVRERAPGQGGKKRRSRSSSGSMKAVLSRDERKPAVSDGAKDA